MIFDSDDNDNDLSFDGKPKKVSPASSLPTRPATKSPFGPNVTQGGQANTPTRKPSAPFNQGVPSSRPQRPAFLDNAKQPEALPTRPESQAASPFSRPTTPQPQEQTQTAPTLPDLSSYIPSKKSEQQPIQTPPVSDQDGRASEQELYMRTVREEAEQRRVAAAQQHAEQIPVPQPMPPTNVAMYGHVQAPQQGQPMPADFQQQQQQQPTGKKGKTKRVKNVPVSKANKPVKEKTFAGERKKVLYIRLIAGSVAAVIAIAGGKAIFFGDTGPNREQVMSAAQEAVNYTGFPSASGEQFSIDFTKAYFNFNSDGAEERVKSLERFASPELVKQINIAVLSPAEYAAIQKSGTSYSDYKVTQSIAYGPYVVATNNLDEKNAVFTVKVGLETGTVIYLDVPVKHDPGNYSLTLAGPPSFSKPIQNQGEAKKEEWTSVFEGGGDDELQKSIQGDLEAYLSAWALSEETIINRYTLESATDNAKRGLQGSVQLNQIITLQVEPQSDDRPSTATSRRVEVNVMWEDPDTSLRYPQQYRMLIGLNPEGKWAIHDIENFSVLN